MRKKNSYSLVDVNEILIQVLSGRRAGQSAHVGVDVAKGELKGTSPFTCMVSDDIVYRMPRSARAAPGGEIFHVINRANGRLRLFRTDKDFLAFERVMMEACRRHPIRLLGWCIMGNHWHFVAWPEEDGQLAKFFGYLGLTHATRWQVAHNAVGSGHVYQGRFKSFMVERDEHLLWVLRYVERNPLRANLVKRAQDWRWSSLHVRQNGPSELREILSEWPIDRPRNWATEVNRPQNEAEEAAIANAIRRTCPLGGHGWVEKMVERYDLASTLRKRGRQTGWRKRDVEDKG